MKSAKSAVKEASVHPLPIKEIEEIKKGAGGSVFNKLNAADWQGLLDCGERLVYRHDDLILQEGQIGEAIYFLADGEVRIEKSGGGQIVELARLGTGSVFGEMSLLDKARASANVVADGHVEVIRVDGSMIDEIMAEDQWFGIHFYNSLAVTLSRRLRAANKIIHGKS